MMKALANPFDRLITNRLLLWIKVHFVQSGFQKLKSTIHQIFTTRLIIEIIKKHKKTLYIGMFDLEKAFNKVSRYQLLKKLAMKGIGNCMLKVLKKIYSNSDIHRYSSRSGFIYSFIHWIHWRFDRLFRGTLCNWTYTRRITLLISCGRNLNNEYFQRSI